MGALGTLTYLAVVLVPVGLRLLLRLLNVGILYSNLLVFLLDLLLPLNSILLRGSSHLL